jgi:predicted transcriptional regulator YdeE
VADGPQFEVYSEDFDGDAGTGSIEIHIPVK